MARAAIPDPGSRQQAEDRFICVAFAISASCVDDG
jgi:hypothetical protein